MPSSKSHFKKLSSTAEESEGFRHAQKIDCCPNGCMIYYKHGEALSACKFFGYAR